MALSGQHSVISEKDNRMLKSELTFLKNDLVLDKGNLFY